MYLYPTLDSYGFFTVDTPFGYQFKTFSKIEAIEYGKTYNQFPEWHYNKNTFSKFKWHINPGLSITDLYKSRAIQLRSAYDYLILFYSSGWDSSAVLQSFIDAGVYPDEIFTFYNSRDTTNQLHDEIQNFAFPKLNAIKKKYPQIKIQKVDYSSWFDKEYKKYLNPENLDYLYGYNTFLVPNKAWQDHVVSFIPEWNTIIQSGKKLGIVYGIDKPQVRYAQGKWIAYFQDTAQSEIGANYQQTLGYGEYRECFFWSENSPLIPIQQAHIIKDYFSNNPAVLNHVDSSTTFGYKISRHDIVKLIYPHVTNQKFYTGKPLIHSLGGRDWKFLIEASQMQKRYWTIAKQVENVLPEYWKNQNNFLKNGAKGHINDYYLN